MIKRILTVSLLSVALVAMPLLEADAHYIVVSGRLLWHSVTCDELLKNVQNLANNPALVTCQAVGTAVETECTNPQGRVVRGQASHPISFFGTATVSQTLAEKKKGRGHATIILTDEDDLGITHEDSGCNNNWTLTRAILREATVTFNTYDCTVDGIAGCQDSDITPQSLASTGELTCTLPASINFDNFHPVDPVDYSCTGSFTHEF